MLHKIMMTPRQAKSLALWVDDGEDAAAVLVNDVDGSSDIYVGQGDCRATIHPDGAVDEED